MADAFDQTLFEFERDENEIIHGIKVDSSGRKQMTPFSHCPIDAYRFAPSMKSGFRESFSLVLIELNLAVAT